MQARFSESTSISAAQLGGLRVAAKIMDKTKSEDASDIFDEMRSAEMFTALKVEPGKSFYWNRYRSDLEIITMKSDVP